MDKIGQLLNLWLVSSGRREPEQVVNGTPVSPKELCDFIDDIWLKQPVVSIDDYESAKRMKAAILEAEQEYLKNHPA